MASKYLQKFPVPAGFQQILADFTREVLRDQPPNIVQYAALYFETLEKGKKLQFGGGKKIDSGFNAKNAQEMAKKASNIAGKINNQQPSKEVIGTQKTVNGEQVNNYMSNLSSKVAAFQQLDEQTKIAVDRVIEQTFKRFDKDKNGQLGHQQFVKFASQVIIELQVNVQDLNEAINQFIKLTDYNKDGTLSKDQLKRFIATQLIEK